MVLDNPSINEGLSFFDTLLPEKYPFYEPALVTVSEGTENRVLSGVFDLCFGLFSYCLM